MSTLQTKKKVDKYPAGRAVVRVLWDKCDFTESGMEGDGRKVGWKGIDELLSIFPVSYGRLNSHSIIASGFAKYLGVAIHDNQFYKSGIAREIWGIFMSIFKARKCLSSLNELKRLKILMALLPKNSELSINVLNLFYKASYDKHSP